MRWVLWVYFFGPLRGALPDAAIESFASVEACQVYRESRLTAWRGYLRANPRLVELAQAIDQVTAPKDPDMSGSAAQIGVGNHTVLIRLVCRESAR